MLIAPATTMVGANGVLPANRVCFCGSNRVQIASHSSPSTLIANHQNTTGNRPNMPTAKPISNVVVTSPNPKAPGLMSASAHCSTADNAANNRACNARNSELTDNAYAMSTNDLRQTPYGDPHAWNASCPDILNADGHSTEQTRQANHVPHTVKIVHESYLAEKECWHVALADSR